MTRKLIIMGILMIPFLLLTRMATAQTYTYEDMPVDVKTEMDFNKIEGKAPWTNIEFKYTVKTEGLEFSEQAEMRQRASQINEILSFTSIGDGIIEVVCKGGTDFDKIKSVFSGLVSNITSFENHPYVNTGKK